MEATPVICPACGELIIAWPEHDGHSMVLPIHPDRVTPFVDCVLSAAAVNSEKTRH